jgi:hypothetical protein
MAGLTTGAKNSMLDNFGTLAVYASLHTADPGTTGANELSGGSPAYARQSLAWNAAASASKTNSGTITWNVPASTTVAYVGYWSASTSGTFYGSRALSASETFSGQGVYTVNASGITENLT